MVGSVKILARPLGKALRLSGDDFIRSFSRKGGRIRQTVVRCFSDSQQNIVRSSFPAAPVPDIPLHEYVFENLHRDGSKIAVECAATGKKFSYEELRKSSVSLAGSIQKKFNLTKGDRVCVVLPNCPEYPVILLAGSKIGVASSTANPLYTANEISVLVNIAQPKIIFTSCEMYNKCLEALNQLKLKIPIITVKLTPQSETPQGAINYSELSESSTPTRCDPVAFDVRDNLFIPFSSGTTGLPKGVELTHGNVTANLVQVESGNAIFPKGDKERQMTVLGVLPMFHIYGLTVICFEALREGARIVYLPGFEPKSFVETIYEKKVNVLYLAPPLFLFLAKQPMVEGKHLKHALHAVNGAAPLGLMDNDVFQKKFPSVKVSQGYGMTETSPVITMTHKDRFHKAQSVGHPLSSTLIKVCDLETGKPLPPHSKGEICVKGPQVMKGYFNQPEITKNSFDSEGWLKTGDIGYYDEDNDLFVEDRLKELIKVKGFQVAPAELEELLRSHPKIADAGVVGVPHPDLGEAPRAFVVIKEGASLKEEEVSGFVKEKLSHHKQLRGGVRFLNAIPKSAAGKILRKNLKNLE